MKNFPLLFCLVLFFASGVFAQTTQPSNCPTVDVSGGGRAEKGQSLFFTATVSNAENREFEYVWTVSDGKIVSGQGTQTITVDLGAKEFVTATVEVQGFPEGCPNTDTENPIWDPRPQPRLFDEYGPLPNGDLESRTHNLFVEIGNNPGAQGYIISYGTNREIARREKQIRDALTLLKVDKTLITLVNGGANPKGKGVWTRVWLVPPGADNPRIDQ